MSPTSSRPRGNGRGTFRTGAARRSRSRIAINGEADRGILIASVLAEVQKALQGARAKPELSAFPKFKGATLTLQTVITKSIGGKIKLLIFSFGRTWEKERSHELVLKLNPPPSATGRTLMVERTLAQDLEDAIVEAARGVRDAETGNPPLRLNTFSATISFVVTEDGSAGFEEFKILPVTLELKGELKKKAVHTIALEFER